MNSFLQMLFNIEPLRDSLIRETITTKISDFKLSIYQLQRLFILMKLSSRNFINPRSFRSTLPSYFQSFQQQDASEFAKIILDKIESEEISICKKDKTACVANKFLMGHLTQKIECQTCGNSSIK